MYIYICVYSAKPCSRETLAASSDTPALNRVGTGMLPLEHQKPKFHTKTLNANRTLKGSLEVRRNSPITIPMPDCPKPQSSPLSMFERSPQRNP